MRQFEIEIYTSLKEPIGSDGIKLNTELFTRAIVNEDKIGMFIQCNLQYLGNIVRGVHVWEKAT